MARVFGTGFENQSYGGLEDSGDPPIASTDGLDMGGDYCCFLNYANDFLKKAFIESYSELYLSRKLRTNEFATTGCGIFKFFNSIGTEILNIYVDDDLQKILIKRGDIYGTLLATGSISINLNTTYCIEVFYKPLNSDGQIIVKVDGVEDINYTGDTTNSSYENIAIVVIGGSNLAWQYVDDFIIDDSDWIGIGHTFVGGIITGAGSSSQWTSSTGSTNYSNIDEIPFSDTDYNSTNTVDALDLYSTNDCFSGLNIDSITGIYLNVRVGYEGIPTPTKIKAALKSSTTVTVSSNITNAFSFNDDQKIFEINPHTSTTFTTGDFSAGIEVGIKAVT